VAGGAKEPGRSVISKIAAILQVVSDGGGRTLTEIAARSGLPLSTVHRLATELAAWRVLARDEEGRYRAGPSLWAAGACQPDGPACVPDVRGRAAPVLEDLFRATGVPVRVGFLDGAAVSYVEKVSARRPVSWLSPAARLPVHATALGKALLAFAPTSTVEAVLALGLRRYTPHTVTRPERLRWALRAVRATGIALCDRELDRTGRAVAAPVFGDGGRGVAAVEIAVRNLARDVPALRAPLAVAAAWLSRELAGQVGEVCEVGDGRLGSVDERVLGEPAWGSA
jgi:DNA-binding IclR family transcriptional regulator